MNEKDVKNIGKILVIVAVIVCGISLILPWSGFSMNMMGINVGLDYYPWGGHAYADMGSMGSMMGDSTSTSFDAWILFYSVALGGPDAGSSTSSTVDTSNIPMIAMFILSFIMCIAGLIFGILSFLKIKSKNVILPLVSGITTLLAIIFFLIGLNVSFSSQGAQQYSSLVGYSAGFYLIIVSMILFFVFFALMKFVTPTPVPMAQAPQTPPQPVPPQSPQQPQTPPAESFEKIEK